MFDVCCFNTNLHIVSRIRVALLIRGMPCETSVDVHTKGEKVSRCYVDIRFIFI
jgi:hypothetical protein